MCYSSPHRHLILIIEVSDEAVLVVVVPLVEGYERWEVWPISVLLVSHVICNSAHVCVRVCVCVCVCVWCEQIKDSQARNSETHVQLYFVIIRAKSNNMIELVLFKEWDCGYYQTSIFHTASTLRPIYMLEFGCIQFSLVIWSSILYAISYATLWLSDFVMHTLWL